MSTMFFVKKKEPPEPETCIVCAEFLPIDETMSGPYNDSSTDAAVQDEHPTSWQPMLFPTFNEIMAGFHYHSSTDAVVQDEHPASGHHSVSLPTDQIQPAITSRVRHPDPEYRTPPKSSPVRKRQPVRKKGKNDIWPKCTLRTRLRKSLDDPDESEELDMNDVPIDMFKKEESPEPDVVNLPDPFAIYLAGPGADQINEDM